MRKYLIALAILILVQKSNVVVAQSNIRTYQIQSLDGKESKVKIWDDFENGIVRIIYLKDTINVYESTGIDKTEILNNNFIKINYRFRGGSDMAVGNVIILCVNNNKLYEVAHVLDYINWDVHGEKEDYSLKVFLTGSDKKSYKLNVNIYDRFSSKNKPQSNYKYYNLSTLSFDLNRNVFYSLKENIYQSFTIYDHKTGKEYIQQIRGNYPVIILRKDNYYFIKNEWYDVGDKNHLNHYSSRSEN
jgi:hypothetical protein